MYGLEVLLAVYCGVNEGAGEGEVKGEGEHERANEVVMRLSVRVVEFLTRDHASSIKVNAVKRLWW